MQTRLPSSTVFSLLAVLLLRALIPVGYMPSSLADGLPFVLCPDNLPVAFAAKIGGEHHDHSGHHDAPDSVAADECDFDEMLLSAAPPMDVDPVGIAPPAAPLESVVPRLIIGRSQISDRARGPPWHEQV